MVIPTHPDAPTLGGRSHTSAVHRSTANLPVESINLPGSASFLYLEAFALESLTPLPGAGGYPKLRPSDLAVNNASAAQHAASTVDDTPSSAARRSDRARVADVILTPPLFINGPATSPALKAAESVPTLVSDVGDGAAHALAGGDGTDMRNFSFSGEFYTRRSYLPLGQVMGPSVVLFAFVILFLFSVAHSAKTLKQAGSHSSRRNHLRYDDQRRRRPAAHIAAPGIQVACPAHIVHAPPSYHAHGEPALLYPVHGQVAPPAWTPSPDISVEPHDCVGSLNGPDRC